MWQEMIYFVFPLASSADDTSFWVHRRNHMDLVGGRNDVLGTIICTLKSRRLLSYFIFLSEPNLVHFLFFPVHEEAQIILIAHNFIKVGEKCVPLEILVNGFENHKFWLNFDCHRSHDSQASKIDQITIEIFTVFSI